MDLTLLVGAIVLIALLVIAAVVLAGTSKKTLPLVAKRLMSNREREAITVLEQLFPDCRIHSQVAMAAVLTTKTGLDKKTRASIRNRFDRKIIDYVIEERISGEIVMIVELDDKTHNPSKDATRDAMTAAAGYRTVRIPPKARLELPSLAPLFAPPPVQEA